jgi:hypothetical protein
MDCKYRLFNGSMKGKKMTSYHKTNFGLFGAKLITDQNGFTHTTADEWMQAPVDIADDDRTDDWAEQMADDSVRVLDVAEASVIAWRQEQ